MREIDSNLPILGNIRIPFYKESTRLFGLFERDIFRLNEFSHLGVASKVFTGAHHTRLEYCLLQCAIVRIISKFFKNSEQLGIANEVDLPGIKRPVSSGEELIKCWILLLNLGHTKYTFAVERVLLKRCLNDPVFRSRLFATCVNSEFRKWAANIVDNFVYEEFHKILALGHVNTIKRKQDKGLYRQILRAVVFPVEDISFKSTQQREKLEKLRKLHGRIRIVAQIAIDSFYSHLPVELKLNQLLINLDQVMNSTTLEDDYKKVYNQLGSFLAKEVYLHPKSVALLTKYEADGLRKVDKRKWKKSFPLFLSTVREAGFGEPKLGNWRPFLRLALQRNAVPQPRIRKATEELVRTLGMRNIFHVSLINNTFHDDQYLDVSVDRHNVRLAQLLRLLQRLCSWLLDGAEREAQVRIADIKRNVPKATLPQMNTFLENVRRRTLQSAVFEFRGQCADIVASVLRMVVKQEYGVEFIHPSNLPAVCLRVEYPNGDEYDGITKVYDDYLKYFSPNPDRTKEIKATFRQFRQAKQPLTLVCFADIIVTDTDGKKKDEWDGFVLGFSPQQLSTTILEIKNMGARSEQAAFDQLKDTKEFLNGAVVKSMRRRRIRRNGCALDLL